jgi:hypothetical protein
MKGVAPPRNHHAPSLHGGSALHRDEPFDSCLDFLVSDDRDLASGGAEPVMLIRSAISLTN